MDDREFLNYISAHLIDDKNITLQGKDSLTIKVIGKDKIDWQKLIDFCEDAIKAYESEDYKKLFPNYPNLEPVNEETIIELDNELLDSICNENFNKIHLAIPEFIADDEFSFSYTNYSKKENEILSHIGVEDLKESYALGNLSITKIEKLKRKNIYAYSHDEGKVLPYKKWRLYDCLIAEVIKNNNCYILSGGEWRKVDDDFYKSINEFIDNILIEKNISGKFHDINIFCNIKNQNREEKFNEAYCKNNQNAFLFDQAKLKIGSGRSDNEFCDILELGDDQIGNIVHVKRKSGSSALNHLFSQARYYCEFFLSDEIFISEIRSFISNSKHSNKSNFLRHIKSNTADIVGKDYKVSLWVLFDNNKKRPSKSELPLMAKYELKLAHDRLRNILKYSEVSISMIPVEMIKHKNLKKNKK